MMTKRYRVYFSYDVGVEAENPFEAVQNATILLQNDTPAEEIKLLLSAYRVDSVLDEDEATDEATA